MARIIYTDRETPETIPDLFEQDCVYNGIDVLATRQVFDAIHPQLDQHTSATYDLSRALQGPTVEMGLRGVLVDQARKAEVIDDLYEKIEYLQRNLERIVLEGVGLSSFNWRSNPDLQELFYNRLGIPVIRKQGRPTVDRNALEKMEAYTIARPIVAHMSAMRELAKKISVLKTEIDADGRMRTSYNIAGTNTGRFSSSFSQFGTGGNLQNVEEGLRSIFISDPGMKWAKCDAKSGESFVVGAIEWNLFNDDRYLEVCQSGDPHTSAAKLCWPGLPWTGNLKKDKDVAGGLFYRHHSYRDTTKKIGHGSNYGGKPKTLSDMYKLPIEVVSVFQKVYFNAFPAHNQWQDWVRSELLTKGHLISLGGRKRWFFGRRNEDDTVRAAIAYDPQETLAKVVNTAMLNIWRQGYCDVVMHDHDALTFQYPEEQEDEIIPRLMKDLIVRIPLGKGRELAIPYDCKVGWNKGDYSEANPEGLKDYTGKDNRKRREEVGLLDRVVRRAYR